MSENRPIYWSPSSAWLSLRRVGPQLADTLLYVARPRDLEEANASRQFIRSLHVVRYEWIVYDRASYLGGHLQASSYPLIPRTRPSIHEIGDAMEDILSIYTKRRLGKYPGVHKQLGRVSKPAWFSCLSPRRPAPSLLFL